MCLGILIGVFTPTNVRAERPVRGYVRNLILLLLIGCWGDLVAEPHDATIRRQRPLAPTTSPEAAENRMETLIEQLKSKSQGTRIYAAKALGALDPRLAAAAVPALRDALKDDIARGKKPPFSEEDFLNLEARKMAAIALGKIAPQDLTTIQYLANELFRRDEIAVASREALVKIGKKAAPALAEMLLFNDSVAAEHAALALSDLGENAQEVAPQIARVLTKGWANSAARSTAAQILGNIADPADPEVTEILKNAANYKYAPFGYEKYASERRAEAAVSGQAKQALKTLEGRKKKP